MSKIQWTDMTANPLKEGKEIDGKLVRNGNYCVPVSTGCKNCYASILNARGTRFGGNGRPFGVRKEGHPEMFLNLPMLRKWEGMRKNKKIFVGSMTDWGGDWVPEWMMCCMLDAMANSVATFQLLSKRPQRIAEITKIWLSLYDHSQFPANIWIGTSAADQQRLDERLIWLIRTAAQIRFLSLEPLLGPLTLFDVVCPVDKIDWVIVGGESGPNARPLDLEWIEDIITQCRDANIPVFVKQLGTAWAAEAGAIDRKGGNPEEWPNIFRIRMMPGDTWPELCYYCGAYWVDPDQELCDDCLELV